MKGPPTPIELLHQWSRKQQAFILALVSNLTITQREAFRRAGYSAKDDAAADFNASKLLRNPRIDRAYKALRVQATRVAVENAQLTAQRVLEEVAAQVRAGLNARFRNWTSSTNEALTA